MQGERERFKGLIIVALTHKDKFREGRREGRERVVKIAAQVK